MNILHKTLLSCALGGALLAPTLSEASSQSPQERFAQLRDKYVSAIQPLEKETNEAWWESSTTGSDAAYARREAAEKAMAKLHQDPQLFAQLKELRQGQPLADPVEARQLEIMYFNFLPYQADPQVTHQIIALETEVDKIFNTHRSRVGSKELTENEVRQILSTTSDSAQAQAAWEGYMAVGRKVAPPLKKLVQLRNQMARQLGYKDYFLMQLAVQEFEPQELLATFEELDRLTLAPFKELKGEIDAYQRQRFQLKEEEPLRPWHLGDLFFQEAPELKTAGINLDDLYEGQDPVKLSTKYYHSLNLDPQAIIERSDLYERPGKSPHAFETCIDRQQDIRVLCNVKPNALWMDTVNHELGHGLYDQHIDPQLPYLLRTPAHILTTEGLAMLMGEMTRTPDFLAQVLEVPASKLPPYAQASWKLLRSERLVFSRWTQTMLHFEKEMYANPEQDLNRLWWDLKKRYQLQEPPTELSGADYGAKMHVVGAPVYYHNYMLGDLFAAQIYAHLLEKLKLDPAQHPSLYAQPQAGELLKNQLFAPGNRYPWPELVKRVTGQELSPKAFAQLFLH